MLGLRLDEPLVLSGLREAVDLYAARRLEGLGLARLDAEGTHAPTLVLTRRGRFLGGGVTAELIA
jgi:hypothetical protein